MRQSQSLDQQVGELFEEPRARPLSSKRLLRDLLREFSRAEKRSERERRWDSPKDDATKDYRPLYKKAAAEYLAYVGADPKLDGDIEASLDFARQRAAPRLELVDPGFERVAVSPEFCRDELGTLVVLAVLLHRSFGPLCVVLPAVQQNSRDDRFVFGKDVSLNHEALPQNSFRGKPAAIDFRAYAFDHDATSQFLGL